jgi:hypothetical protein
MFMEKLSRILIACCFLMGSCCDEDFVIPGSLDYDFYEHALDVTDLIGDCSEHQAYTTMEATPDFNAGDCWINNSTTVSNRWFKFLAPDTNEIWVTVLVGGEYGTQSRTQVAIWDTDGITQLACARFYDDGDFVYLHTSNVLEPGVYYYISVDVADDGSQGSFSMCLDDTD